MNGLQLVKYPLRILRDKVRSINAARLTRRRVATSRFDPSFFTPSSFDAWPLKRDIIGFVSRMRDSGSLAAYRYSATTRQPTLYSSAYACMTLSLLGEIQSYAKNEKAAWLAYFDSFQSAEDGLFYDPVVDSQLFRTFDWWGARHLALHMVSAYTVLGGRPRYPFRFVGEYYDTDRIRRWLDGVAWDESFGYAEDIDNKIMRLSIWPE